MINNINNNANSIRSFGNKIKMYFKNKVFPIVTTNSKYKKITDESR